MDNAGHLIVPMGVITFSYCKTCTDYTLNVFQFLSAYPTDIIINIRILHNIIIGTNDLILGGYHKSNRPSSGKSLPGFSHAFDGNFGNLISVGYFKVIIIIIIIIINVIGN